MATIVEIPCRSAVADWLPADSVGAEIGVWRGEFAAVLATRARELHLIDWWTQQKKDADKQAAEARLAGLGNLVWHDADVTRILPTFPNAYFDWIYVDSLHNYGSVRRDIALSLPKVKPGGLLCGHDLYCNAKPNGWGTGVQRAVLEAVQDGRIRIVALSRETLTDWIAEVVL